MTAPERLKVLYITGSGRSGSTLLGSVLGQLDGFFDGGELSRIWSRGALENQLCGCGVPFRQCRLWQAVLDKAVGGLAGLHVQDMITPDQGARTRHLLSAALPRGAERLERRLGPHLQILARLYGAIRGVTGSQVIVDASKSPAYGLALGLIPSVDLSIVHLVRDARAVAHSFGRWKARPDSPQRPYMRRLGPSRSAAAWVVWNVAAEWLGRRHPRRYVRVRYEDFVARPRDALERILGAAAVDRVPDLPLVGDRGVTLEATHTVSGNPDRMQTGLVALREDDEWRTSMARRARGLVTALTWPLLLRYGYAWSGRRAGTAGAP